MRGCFAFACIYVYKYTKAYIKMQEPRLSRTLCAPAVHIGTPTNLWSPWDIQLPRLRLSEEVFEDKIDEGK